MGQKKKDLSFLTDTRKYIERFLKIKTKSNHIAPFLLNEPQERLYEVIQQQEKAGE